MSITRAAGFAFVGLVWGAMAYLLGADVLGTPIVGGVLASPLIGIAVGHSLHRHFYAEALWKRAAVALVTLYTAAILFGLVVGLWDWVGSNATRSPEVVMQGALAVLYGTTLFLIVLWPLAYLTHRVLAADVLGWLRP